MHRSNLAAEEPPQTVTARRHHFLSQTYLANFTSDGTKDGEFYVVDVPSGSSFKTSPLNVGVERDFNKVDVEGKPLDALESALGGFDGQAGAAIRSVVLNQRFPEGDDYVFILNFITLIAVRNPGMRQSFNRSRTHSMAVVTDLMLANPKIYEKTMRDARAAGYLNDADPVVPYEEMKRSVETGKYELEWPPESHHRAEFKAFNSLLPIMAKRQWSVIVSPTDAPSFICCDHPASLVSMSPDVSRHFGYGTPGTDVFVPLGPRVGMIGRFETDLPPMMVATVDGVARLNTRVAKRALRHIYSTNECFHLFDNGAVRVVNCSIEGK